MSSPVSVVILAAGLGTRMKSKTAKVLHRAGGLTLVEHVVRTALTQADPADICVVIGHQADQVRATLAPYEVIFAEQKEQKGTGHALAAWAGTARRRDGLVVVLYGDCPLLTPQTLRQLLATQMSGSAAATVITTMVLDPYGYGRIVRTQDGRVAAIVEQKAASAEQQAIREINSGIYCFEAEHLFPALSKLQPNPASGEFYLTDVVELLQTAGQSMVPHVLADAREILGINTRVELASADQILRERKVQDLMLGGVTIEKPETVTVDADVEIGIDTILEPFCQLRGRTSIGTDCRIGAGSILQDTAIGDAVHIAPYTLINESQVGNGASIGPFARLRMKNTVGAGAHIGNFVELKKAEFGDGAKAGHLAYLGDCQIGERVNVGAGAITCNYDGKHKHETKVGRDSFVGSNSTLIAPVEVGEGSYIAAGSVITHSVPQDALALGRSRQVVKNDWAKSRREKSK